MLSRHSFTEPIEWPLFSLQLAFSDLGYIAATTWDDVSARNIARVWYLDQGLDVPYDVEDEYDRPTILFQAAGLVLPKVGAYSTPQCVYIKGIRKLSWSQ